MKRTTYPSLIFLAVLFSTLLYACKNTTQQSQPPVAKKIPKELVIHGDTRIDNYYWMNDRENKDVLDYLHAENDYLKELLKPVEGLQKNLFAEMKGRIKEQDESVPYRIGDYFYYTKYTEGGEYPVYCRKKGNLEGKEEIMLDGNERSKGLSYFSCSGVVISQDGKLGAYAIDTVGRRISSIFFKDLTTGKEFPDRIDHVSGNMVWAADNMNLFYSKQDPQTLRYHQIYRHKLGSLPSEDVLVYEEKDETFSCYVAETKSKKYLTIISYSTLSSETRILESINPTGQFRPFQEREKDLEYDIEHAGDKFYIRTNINGAKNYTLMETTEDKTTATHWKTIIPHRDYVFLGGFDVLEGHLFTEERANGLVKIKIIDLSNGKEDHLHFEEPVYTTNLGFNPQYDGTKFRISYSSMITPPTVFEYDIATGTKEVLKQEEIVGGYDKNLYATERIFATAKDGTKIPVLLAYKKELFRNDGSNPLLQYAYGSYGANMDARFSSTRLSLLDRGFIYAITQIRGGQEMGRHWYENGKLLKKMNTFTDFIDCSEYLIQNNYTNRDRLFAAGGSAGGLLMGVIVNLKPEIYKGVIAAVPFVDVVTTMLDETIPLTTSEYDEWGNPNEEDYYKYMLSYSPYDNVKKQAYPNILVTSGLHDSQVQYFEPTKWVAKLRDMKTDDNLILLYTNMEAGHGGASGRFSRLKELALEYSFILYLAGIDK